MILAGKKIVLGVTGGIAAYKALSLIRLLKQSGAEVRVALTPSGEKMVGRPSFETLAGTPVMQDPFEIAAGSITHIEAARWADAVVIYPCTAQTIAKLAAGLADDMLSLIALATRSPLLLFPAMNGAMWDHPATQRNLRQLTEDGVRIVSPADGEMACGETGKGRLPEPEVAWEWCLDTLASPTLPESTGRVLIAVGRTEEAIDPIRVITNRSSGKTGLALARRFRLSGWKVTLVAGPVDTPLPPWADLIRVRSAEEMRKAVLQESSRCAVVIMAAAVADFRPANASSLKIKQSRENTVLPLLPNPDILFELSRNKRSDQRVVGFALETDNAVENGVKKIGEKGCDLLVINNPTVSGGGFGKEEVEWGLLTPSGLEVPLRFGTKEALAESVVTWCCRELHRDGEGQC